MNANPVVKKLRKRWLSLPLLAIAMLIAVVIRYWPRAPLAAQIPSSVAIFDTRGELLRLTLASDQQYRVWTPLENISPQVIDALLLHEDQHFYRHPGVNPVALVRASFATYTGGTRQGGSTLTMQLARLLYGLNTRTIVGKCKQIGFALGLELRYSKRELLEAHVNLMPYGGNVQGVGAASLVYFGKSADKLGLGQALSLVVIPQSPARRGPDEIEPESLRAARVRLFNRWIADHPDAKSEADLIALPLRYSRLEQLPFRAPHFTASILEKYRSPDIGARQSIYTTLDARLQRISEQIVNRYVREQNNGIRNAAALLVDSRDMSVRAMVGSADFFSADIQGQVNGTLAKRSPGSALKPFIYALAMDQGLIHPMTVLKDAPTHFGSFSPENFDGRFAGPLTATEALTRSRNIPAVALNSRLTQPTFYQFLRTAGIANMFSEKHYGLALALGGGEVTMEETATLYAMLANHGAMSSLRYLRDEASREGTQVLSNEASFMTLDMLASAPRPDNAGTVTSSLPIAWKTGTSWGFRDAWTAGVFGPYVLVVWVGNFDGSSNSAFVGVQAAAPLFFRLSDAIAARERNWQPMVAPERLVRVDVCSASGELPNAECPKTSTTWFIPGVSPIKVSQIHRRVYIDSRTGKQTCPPYDARNTRSEVFEFWPSDLLQLFSQAGMPRRKPPEPIECESSNLVANGTPPRITSPIATVTYAVRSQGNDNVIPLTANTEGGVQRVHWFIDESYLGTSAANEALAWIAPSSGRHLVRAIDDQGRADSREVNVSLLP